MMIITMMTTTMMTITRLIHYVTSSTFNLKYRLLTSNVYSSPCQVKVPVITLFSSMCIDALDVGSPERMNIVQLYVHLYGT